MYLLLLTALLGTSSGPDIMRVEEDWELVLNWPDAEMQAPQFTTLMSPFEHTDSLFTQVNWNHRELWNFSGGGLQIQAWNGDTFLAKHSVASNNLSTVAETVSWTQKLETTGSFVSFNIQNGQSTTWGSFGGPSMGLSGNFPLPDLNGYSSNTSVGNSCITFGSNRVQLLRIKQVRFYDGSGNLVNVDSDPKIVFSQ